MERFTVSASLPRTPECPICRLALIQSCTSFWSGLAVCASCFETVSPHILFKSLTAHHDPALAAHFSFHAGLIFFTPGPAFPPRVSVHFYNHRVPPIHQPIKQ